MGSFLCPHICDKTNVKPGADFGAAAKPRHLAKNQRPGSKGLINNNFWRFFGHYAS